MSVCFFVPAASSSAEEGQSPPNEAGTSSSAAVSEEQSSADTAEQQLAQFWTNVNTNIQTLQSDHFKHQILPLARIKKIMKLDEEVKMISAEAPVLFAKAAEIFIHELTLRAWSHTEDNKRRTLQRNDIAMAISKSDQFDFLIDIVPRQEVKAAPARREEPPAARAPAHSAPPTDPLSTPAHALQSSVQSQIVLQPCSQVVQGAAAAGAQQPVTLVQQIVNPNGEVQLMPIQLSQAQLNMIRLQMQSNPNQPILIQAGQPQQSPQIIQVTSQAPQQQQVFLAQAPSAQEEA